MEFLAIVCFLAACAAWAYSRILVNRLAEANEKNRTLERQVSAVRDQAEKDIREIQDLLRNQREAHQRELDSVAPFRAIRDAAAALKVMQDRTSLMLKTAQAQAADEIGEARATIERLKREAAAEISAGRKQHRDDLQEKAAAMEKKINEAMEQADQIIREARNRAELIAGDAYKAKEQSIALTTAAKAMSNVIDGYGDRYLKPTYSLLDELAAQYSFDDAGRQLKLARERSKMLLDSRRSATCEYVEKERRETAVNFVTDAFNGKVDSILTGVKSTNHGTLEQKIRDSFALVNHLGAAFRGARITDQYLDARLMELKWASAVQAIKEQEREQQRLIREQIREEERAQKEFERAQKEAERDEQAVRRAMEKAEAQLEKATAEQKLRFEAQLEELRGKLAEAEAKSQRALSMAQQTKAGHVYVISNIGSFGEDVFKIGMTRRLEPVERVTELGDASVPFPFDIHAMIYSEDAPQLERELHHLFLTRQINKVNPRKEFFKLGVTEIKAAVEQRNLKAIWTLSAEAAQYRESLELEKRIQESAVARAEWEAAQRKVDPVTVDAPGVEAPEAATA